MKIGIYADICLIGFLKYCVAIRQVEVLCSVKRLNSIKQFKLKSAFDLIDSFSRNFSELWAKKTLTNKKHFVWFTKPQFELLNISISFKHFKTQNSVHNCMNYIIRVGVDFFQLCCLKIICSKIKTWEIPSKIAHCSADSNAMKFLYTMCSCVVWNCV